MAHHDPGCQCPVDVHEVIDDKLPLRRPCSKGLLCAGLQEVDRSIVKRIPLIAHCWERHLESSFHWHSTFAACRVVNADNALLELCYTRHLSTDGRGGGLI